MERFNALRSRWLIPALVLVGMLPGAVAQGLPSVVSTPRAPWPSFTDEVPGSTATGGAIFDLAAFGDTLILSGRFTLASESCGSGIIIDAPTGALRRPFKDVDRFVRVAIPDRAGGWYIAGDFNDVGGLTRPLVAHLLPDGSTDPTFDAAAFLAPPSLVESVTSLALVQDRLFVGGQMAVVSGAAQPHLGVVALHAATGALLPWNPLTSAHPIFPPSVSFLASYGNHLIVCGSFLSTPSGASGELITLDVLTGAPGPIGSVTGSVNTVVVRGTTAYLGGEFSAVSGLPRANLAAVDITTLTVTPWDPGTDGAVNALEADATRVFAAGQFTKVGGVPRNGLAAIARATGAVTALDTPPTNPTGSSMVSPGIAALAVMGSKLYVGGNFSSMGGLQRRGFAVIDLPSSTVDALDLGLRNHVATLAASRSALYIGGLIHGVNSQAISRGIAAIDANTGAIVPLPVSISGSQNAPVRLAVDGSTLWMAGDFSAVNGVPRSGLAAVDLTSGTVLPPTIAHNGTSLGIHLHGTTLYLQGNFTTVNGQPRHGLAAIDTATGSLLPFNPSILGAWDLLSANGTTLFASGYFSRNGGSQQRHVAAFDAQTGTALNWDPSPAGNLHLVALAATDVGVYIQATFTSIGGMPRPGIAEIDPVTALPTAWSPLVEGFPGEVLHVLGSSVIALRRSNQPRLVEIDRTTGAEVSAFTFSREALVHAVTTAGGSLHVAGRFRHVDENSSHINLLSLPIARPAASVVPLGVGCSPVGAPPVLTSSRPVLGSLLTDAIVATPSSFGEIYISLVPQAPLPVTPSCVVYLDPRSLALTTHFMTDLNGFANTPYVLPALESLWGLTIRKQAVVYPPLAGFELTNALELTLGY